MKDSARMMLDQCGKAQNLHEWLNAIVSGEEIH